jgi:diguanylate cyclase (GGDEF)-like protein/PAS domain S-box-containing protein
MDSLCRDDIPARSASRENIRSGHRPRAVLKVIGCITQEHDLRLVLLAAVICAIACFTTLTLLARAQGATRRASGVWLVAAAGLFGCGVWSLHFVAMLAFMPHLSIAYDIATTIASVVIASTGALLAFVAWRLPRSRPLGVLAGGALLGLSVAGMHYTGVAAMRLSGSLDLDRAGIAASILVSIGFATLALARADRLALKARRIEVSGWLALAICGLHFTAMSALTITPGLAGSTDGTVLGSTSLALAVGAVSLSILLLSLAATVIEQHLWQRALETGRLRRMASVAREGILIYRDGRILEANDAFCSLLGQRPDTVIGRHVSEFLSPDSAAATAERVRSTADDLPLIKIELRHNDGRSIPVEVSSRIIDHDGKPARVAAISDLSDRKRAEERMRHLAHHDALTDLPNRFLLHERLAHALDVAARTNTSVAVLNLDLDHFKPVNDVLGHAGGDMLLVQVSKRLLGTLRAMDTLARIGGDEFVIVLPMMDQPQGAAAMAERLVESLARPFDLAGRQVEIGVSVGIALYPDDGGTQEALLLNADTAMYRAKQNERGSFCFFEAVMDEQLLERRMLEQDLRHAVARGEMELHYQPLVNARSGEVDGFEALLRWHHPQRGMIAPMAFIPLAEETGLITRIGQWVLETACSEAAGWAEPRWIAVNLSPVQFRQAGLPQMVADTLARTGLAPGRLEIEVTEGVLIDDTVRAVGVLSALRGLGVRVSLDDFGTGYSSLSYLRSFKFDKLKIDKSFVQGLGQDEEATTIVRAVIGLGHNLALSIVAEGVETQTQLDALQALGCDQVQGYLLGRPVPREGLSELTAARARSAIARDVVWHERVELGERKIVFLKSGPS